MPCATRVLLCDGGMGSRVQALTLDIERDYWGRENCTEVLNLSRPDLVREIHRGYFAAGADMVETNSFGGSPVTLGEFDLADRAFEINRRRRRTGARGGGGIRRRAASLGDRQRSGPAPSCRASATSPTTRWKRRWPSSAAA